MPLRLEDGCAVFEGVCAPEEADALLEWLRATPRPAADLAACAQLHTALLQLLMAAGATLRAPPADRVLAGCLRACLPAGCPGPGEFKVESGVEAGEESGMESGIESGAEDDAAAAPDSAPDENLLETTSAPDWAERGVPPAHPTVEAGPGQRPLRQPRRRP